MKIKTLILSVLALSLVKESEPSQFLNISKTVTAQIKNYELKKYQKIAFCVFSLIKLKETYWFQSLIYKRIYKLK